MDALRFKCDLLWAQLDALHYAYVEPGNIPPGAWRPDVVGRPIRPSAPVGAAGIGRP